MKTTKCEICFEQVTVVNLIIMANLNEGSLVSCTPCLNDLKIRLNEREAKESIWHKHENHNFFNFNDRF